MSYAAWTVLAQELGEVIRGYGFGSHSEIETQIAIDFTALNRSVSESTPPLLLIV